MSHFTNPAAGSYMRGTNEMKFKLKVTLKHTGHWFLFLLCPQCLAPGDSKRTSDFTFGVFSTQQQNLICCILAFNFSFSNVKLPWSISFSSPLKLFRVSANLRRKHAQNVRAPLRTPQLKVFLTHNNGGFFSSKEVWLHTLSLLYLRPVWTQKTRGSHQLFISRLPAEQ